MSLTGNTLCEDKLTWRSLVSRSLQAHPNPPERAPRYYRIFMDLVQGRPCRCGGRRGTGFQAHHLSALAAALDLALGVA